MNAVHSGMMKSSNGDLSLENSRWFLAMAGYYASDPDNILKESNLTKSLRSLSFLSSNTSSKANESMASFRLANDHPYPFLPSPAELREELIPILSEIRGQYPYITTNLNLSHPTSSHDLVSMNVLVRLYDAKRSQKIKIKLGSFQDKYGRLFWEVGFVYLDKSIRQALPKLLHQRARGDYFLLKDLVDCTKRFIARREKALGLDITPAYYHVASLCKRMGGIPEDAATLDHHLGEIHDAFQRYIDCNHHWYVIDPSHQCRLAISWLLEKGLLRNADGKTILWHPPRFIWKSFCSSNPPRIQPDQNPNGAGVPMSQAAPAFDIPLNRAQT